MQGIEPIRARVAELDLAGARVDLTDGSMDAQVRERERGVTHTCTHMYTVHPCVP